MKFRIIVIRGFFLILSLYTVDLVIYFLHLINKISPKFSYIFSTALVLDTFNSDLLKVDLNFG